LERQLPVLAGGARDLEARQQTMRATLDWSEELLSPDEKRLFRRLAVFVGGFTLEAAEAVCAAPEGAEPLGVEVLGGLESLVDQGLVQPWMVAQINDREEEKGERSSEARFRMLFVVREYALERLEASGEAAALQRAHAGYFLALAELADWRKALQAAADRAGGALPAAPCAVGGGACCPTAAGTHEWHSAAAPAS
jgi:non-specific serine/threonine protein kinase